MAKTKELTEDLQLRIVTAHNAARPQSEQNRGAAERGTVVVEIVVVPDDVRLVGGASRCAGILERRERGDWRPVEVSLKDWNLTSAVTACRQLDCGSVLSLEIPKNPQSSGSSFYDRNLQINCSDSVRLQDGAGECSGRLELKSEQGWSSVSEDDFDLRAAQVVCREIGCGAPSDLQGELYGDVDTPGSSKKYRCDGNESALLDCDSSVSNTSGRAVKLTCSEPADFRLAGGAGPCGGTLEIKKMGEWRTVDPDNCDQRWANRVCGLLDCGSLVSIAEKSGREEDLAWSLHSHCAESSLKECFTETKVSEKFLEIACSGRLEVKSDQIWSPVCEEDLDLQGAQVVCREIGCGAPSVFKGGMFGEVEAPFWTKKFQCEGHESALLNCPNSGLTDPDEVRLVGGPSKCSGKLELKHHGEWRPVDHSVRLVNGTDCCSGRLEVRSDQIWSPVCEEDLDLQGAQVVCREIGCESPSVFKGGMFGEVEAPFWTKKFQCEGHESALLDCPDSDLTGNTCPPGRAVGLTCSDPGDVRLVEGPSKCSGKLELKYDAEWRPVDRWDRSWTLEDTGEFYSVRLVNGTDRCSGRLEVRSDQTWSPVCEEDLDLEGAQVVCREIGCGVPSVFKGGMFGEVEAPFWSKKFQCEGHGSALLNCPDSGLTGNTCPPGRAVGLTCSDSVRLVNETDRCSGRLEVRSDQIWSPVCEEDLDLQGAQVVCREIGCGAPLVIQGTMFGGVEAPFWTRDFQCEGNESALLDCGGSGSPRHTCSPGRAAGLSCENPDYIRLVGEPSRCAGSLEIKHMDEWQPLFDSEWDQGSADVVCNMLKCASAVSTRAVKQNNTRPTWHIEPSCVQTASSLFECLDQGPFDSDVGLEVICSDLLVKPTIAFSSSTDGVSEATPQGYQALIGYSFNITCSIKPQYEGGYFQLLFSDSVTTQSYTLTAVNHSAHFLFPPADQSHGGRYSCVYHLRVFSQNFSSESQTLSLAVGAPLIDLIIRCVVLIGGLLIYDTALYCYYKVQTRQIPRTTDDCLLSQ
ncbi:scavenger receptor cysteine-rich type 1 protein M130-like [Cheilinus undulatus]|uniref:scavenger receptor cysteine-rich type 1 protein M130-like n=1 Tax=Cheilinus undulatus TaxID=241271 RepID=UPI001BD4A0CA|nr:scavenger receptor cysteine-rich type 1 protein M130-like [Cheilinus undulatus]